MFTPKKTRIKVRYKNLGGKSKVLKYQMEKDSMTIRFADHSEYVYSNQSAGPENISKMKTLALAGKGLGTFIETSLQEKFSRKVR